MTATSQASRTSSGVASLVRAWWALYLQQRRRERVTPPVPAPEAPSIHYGAFEWDEFEPEWANIWIGWAFGHYGLPIGTFEVWCQWGANDQLVATVPGTDRECLLTHVTQGEDSFFYRVRYRDGEVLGPFSNVYQVDVTV